MEQDFNSDGNLAPGECDLSCNLDKLTGFLGQQWDNAVHGAELIAGDIEHGVNSAYDAAKDGINGVSHAASSISAGVKEVGGKLDNLPANAMPVNTLLAQKIGNSVKPNP